MRIEVAAVVACLVAGCASKDPKVTASDDCWSYLERATDLRKAEKYEDALEEIEKHRICDKSEVEMSYHYHKGWTFHEMGEYQKAIEEFTVGLKTQPSYIGAYWRRGLAYEAMGNLDAAQNDYRQGYEIGVRNDRNKFFKALDKQPEVKEKLLQKWDQ